jgi:PKHD-type hydroxylase
MRGQWCYFSGYFTPESCKDLLARADKYDWSSAGVGQPQDSRLDSYIRKSKTKFLQRSSNEFNDVFDILWKLALQANHEWFNIHITKLDYVQLGEYNSEDQGEYKSHQDVFWISQEAGYHRKLSCIIQLTDPENYEGGDLVFDKLESPAPDASEIRRQGTILFFPSTVYHHVTPVTKGIRHSLVAWFDGPYWR